MSTDTVLTKIDQRGVGRLILNRPDVHNAFDDGLIANLTDALNKLADQSSVRVVVLEGAGKSFSAGADLGWMRRMAELGEDDNRRDAMALARMMTTLDQMPKPTIARVQGAAFGGGVGLVAACDMAVASEAAVFSLSEVRLGLIPAVISPYVIAAIGVRAARRYFLSAERFNATEALRIGLVSEMVAAGKLDETVEELVGAVLKNGPNALAEAKVLIRSVTSKPNDGDMARDTAERIARIRATPEGREGVASFLEKRPPDWVKG